MDSGRVDVRYCLSTGKFRFRFYGVSPDHHTTILLALEQARKELGTKYDTVALEAIMIGYLANTINLSSHPTAPCIGSSSLPNAPPD
jgi:hypothetical protein